VKGRTVNRGAPAWNPANKNITARVLQPDEEIRLSIEDSFPLVEIKQLRPR